MREEECGCDSVECGCEAVAHAQLNQCSHEFSELTTRLVGYEYGERVWVQEECGCVGGEIE